MQAQLIRQRRDSGAIAERLNLFGQRARVVVCRGWTKRLVAGSLSGQPTLIAEPIGIAEFDIGFVSMLGDKVEIAYVKLGKQEVERVPRANVLALDWMT
jgi:hypothetical protein